MDFIYSLAARHSEVIHPLGNNRSRTKHMSVASSHLGQKFHFVPQDLLLQ